MSTPNRSQTLLVPIDVRAFCVGEVDVNGSGGGYGTESFAQIAADFSRLPWVNADNLKCNTEHGPSVSDACLAKPFQPVDEPLEQGIHVHWALPAALTRGAATATSLDFPPVPNRWLVVRITNSVAAWVVESDLLWNQWDPKTGQPIAEIGLPQNSASRAVLTHLDPDDPLPNKPFQALGKVFDYGSWQETSGGTYLQPLTALGYGDPAFAAAYPHCRNVFGFQDLLDHVDAANISYLVVGWYSDSKQDPLATVTYSPQADYQQKLQTISDAYGWTFNGDLSAPFPTQTLCCGIVQNIAWDKSKVYVKQPSFSPEVAVGNTAAEALSAYLANQSDLKVPQLDVEQVLNALQLDLLTGLAEPGGPALLEETEHRRAFGSSHAGNLYVVRPKDDGQGGYPVDKTPPTGGQSIRAPLAPAIASALNALNQAQADFDRMQHQIDALRSQVFVDWHKYMLLQYPPNPSPPGWPSGIDPDKARDFLQAEIEELQGQPKDGGQAWSNLLKNFGTVRDAAKASLEKALGEDYELGTVEGPRYWQATDPVVLLTGSGISPVSRQVGSPCRLSSELKAAKAGPSLPPSPNTSYPAELAALLAEVATGTPGAGIGVIDWNSENPWIPMFLEWQTSLDPMLPIKDAATAYPSDFLATSSALESAATPIDLKTDQAPPANWQSPYQGSILLSSRTTSRLDQQILDYHSQLPQDQFTAAVTSIKSWLSHSPPLMAQALSGFNQALIMRHQTLQLPVCDTLAGTLGVEIYKFQSEVPAAVGDEIRSVSAPNSTYNPLRAGFLKLHKIRLVDAFGQVREVVDAPMIYRAGSLTSQGVQDPTVLALNPRITQPSRLLFRWLSAADAKVEMNSHPASSPICGWVLFNHLDDNLMIYDANGEAMGSLNLNGSLWQGAPGDNFAQPPAKVLVNANPHLRAFVLGVFEKGESYLKDMLAAIDMTLTNIHPSTTKQHRGLAVLIGRPLALVRASLALELEGLPALDQSWDAFNGSVEEFMKNGKLGPRNDASFTGVQFPVRVGNLDNLYDGLIGYFVTGEQDDTSGYEAFYASVAGTQHGGSGVAAPGSLNLQLLPAPQRFWADQPASPPSTAVAAGPPYVAQNLYLSMLVDPRAPVHATTGVLPVKTIEIPPYMYAEALRRMAVTFLTAPLLGNAAQPSISAPIEPGYSWSWVDHDRNGWHTLGDITGPGPQVTPDAPQQIFEGWLQLQKRQSPKG